MLLEVYVYNVVREIHGIVFLTVFNVMRSVVIKVFNQCPVCSGVVVQVSKCVSVQCRLKFQKNDMN